MLTPVGVGVAASGASRTLVCEVWLLFGLTTMMPASAAQGDRDESPEIGSSQGADSQVDGTDSHSTGSRQWTSEEWQAWYESWWTGGSHGIGENQWDNRKKLLVGPMDAMMVDIGLARLLATIPGSGGILGRATMGRATMRSEVVGPIRLWLQSSVLKKIEKESRL